VVDLTIEGPLAENITLSEQVTIEVGEDRVKVPIIVSAGTLPPGTYDVKIKAIATLAPQDKSDQGSVSRSEVGATLGLTFSITGEEISSYTIDQTIIQSTEENIPFGFTYRISNTGNVAARPDQIYIRFTDQADKDNIIEEIVSGEDLPFTEPFQSEDVDVLLKTKLITGKYWTEFGFYQGEEVVYEREDAFLQVFPEGTLSEEGELTLFSADKEQYALNELAIFKGEFTNTGTTGINATLLVDLKHEGVRLEILKSEPVFVLPGKVAKISLEKRLSEEGKYEAEGSITFGISQTASSTVEFQVGSVNQWLIGGVLFLAVLLLGLIIRFITRRKRRVVPDFQRARRELLHYQGGR